MNGFGRSGVSSPASGGDLAFLCSAVPEKHHHVGCPDPSCSAPAVPGTVDEFLSRNQQGPNPTPLLVRQLKNRVRRCPCGKSVAYTLASCNLCGADMSSRPITFVDNVFTGFLYGVERCSAFPLTISVRLQNEEFLVFDDLLSLSPCHLNVIPTTRYIPDWRFLLLRPKEGLELIRNMRALCCKVLKEQFLSDPGFREGTLNPEFTRKRTVEELVGMVRCGFNMPPSQFHLHMQFIFPPHLPYQQLMFLKGNHYTKDRFFPYEYVEAILQIGEAMDVTDDTPAEEIVARFKARGIDYDAVHRNFYEETARNNDMLCNWSPDGFRCFGIGETVRELSSGNEVPGATCKALSAQDKVELQNYGRPYDAKTGKPSGSYYAFSKKPGEVESWV